MSQNAKNVLAYLLLAGVALMSFSSCPLYITVHIGILSASVRLINKVKLSKAHGCVVTQFIVNPLTVLFKKIFSSSYLMYTATYFLISVKIWLILI